MKVQPAGLAGHDAGSTIGQLELASHTCESGTSSMTLLPMLAMSTVQVDASWSHFGQTWIGTVTCVPA